MKKSVSMMRIANKTVKQELYLFLLLSLIPLGLFLLNSSNFFYPLESNYSDLSITHLPNLIYLRESILQDQQVPFWSGQILSGFPFLANPLSGVWYLPLWAVLFLPQPFGFNLLFLIHLLWGGAGVFVYLKGQNLKFLSALAGAMIFTLLPKLFAQFGLGHVTLVFAVCWTPWLLYAEERKISEGGTGLTKAGTGLILGIILLADVRWAAYVSIFIFFYSLFRSFQVWNDHHNPLKIKHFRKFFGELAKWIGLFILQILLAVLIAAPLLLPMLQFTSLSTRGLLTQADNLFLSLSPTDLLGFFFPDIGGYAEWVIYSGGLSTFILLCSVFIKRLRKKTFFWVLLLVLSVSYSLGDHLLINQIITRLPGMDLLRVPGRVMFIGGLCVSVLAAYLLHFLTDNKNELTNREKKTINLGLMAIILFVVVINAAVLLFTSELQKEFLWGGLACLLESVFLKIFLRTKKNLWLAVIILIFVIDLTGVNYLGLNFRSKCEVNSEGAEAAVYISSQTGLFRVYSPSYSIPQQTAALFHLQLVDGIDPLQLVDYVNYMEKASGVPQKGYSVTLPPFSDGDPKTDNKSYLPDPKQLGKLNVRYVVAGFPLDVEGLRLIKETEIDYIYENQEYLPRAWVQEADQETGEGLISAAALTSSSHPNEIRIDAEGPGQLVISEINYPGWKAEVNGKPAEIISKDIFRSVMLESGKNEVHLFYFPSLVLLGLGLSLLGWMFLYFGIIKQGKGLRDEK